jgi:DNA-directed RNA polymerase sigma subunit (sigma70/sigma32)
MKRKRKRRGEQSSGPLDRSAGDYGSHEFADQESRTPEQNAETALLKKDLKLWLRFLEPESRRILYLHFGLVSGYQMSIEQVAAATERTPEGVQKILGEALRKLKTFAELDGWGDAA